MKEKHHVIEDKRELTPTELEAFRRLLFYSVPEAADAIGGVSEQAWRRWEAGTRKIPLDVSERIHKILAWRKATILSMTGELNRLPAHESMTLRWYQSVEDWTADGGQASALWRAYQSACAEVAHRSNGRVNLIMHP